MNEAARLKVNKLSFFGVELDVITGHPEHEILFVASQVAAAAGLNKQAVTDCRLRGGWRGLRIKDLEYAARKSLASLRTTNGRKLSSLAWLFDESTVYLMLMRGNAPQSEPFRRWVTEEVLPSIRKSGTYDIAKSQTPEGLQFADELGALRAALQATTARLESLEATHLHDSSTFGDVRISYHYRGTTLTPTSL
ncbi:BRO-N domain-containing protein [Serratia rhizosphaerae]